MGLVKCRDGFDVLVVMDETQRTTEFDTWYLILDTTVRVEDQMTTGPKTTTKVKTVARESELTS